MSDRCAHNEGPRGNHSQAWDIILRAVISPCAVSPGKLLQHIMYGSCAMIATPPPSYRAESDTSQRFPAPLFLPRPYMVPTLPDTCNSIILSGNSPLWSDPRHPCSRPTGRQELAHGHIPSQQRTGTATGRVTHPYSDTT